jgi:RNA polymerase sigma factor (sigma-70 family)
MSAKELNFDTLMEQVVAGSEDAARLLFEHYEHVLLRVIRKRLNQKARTRLESIDIAQDVWASFFTEPLESRGFKNADAFLAFLTKLARNKVIDASRRHVTAKKNDLSRELSLDDRERINKDVLMSEHPTPSQIVMNKEEWTEYLRKQPPAYRQILILAREGRNAVEIASELGISPRVVRRVLGRLAEAAAT